jgi:hypothetical protein
MNTHFTVARGLYTKTYFVSDLMRMKTSTKFTLARILKTIASAPVKQSQP